MLNEEILTYIRDNLQAGYQKSDIEAALVSSGWSPEDIAAGFVALEKKPLQSKANMTSDQKAANAEIQRIETQVKRANERAAVQATASEEGGIYGFLIRNNFASSKQSANVLFVAGIVFAIALLYWIFLR